jgi:hypothetical protein
MGKFDDYLSPQLQPSMVFVFMAGFMTAQSIMFHFSKEGSTNLKTMGVDTNLPEHSRIGWRKEALWKNQQNHFALFTGGGKSGSERASERMRGVVYV